MILHNSNAEKLLASWNKKNFNTFQFLWNFFTFLKVPFWKTIKLQAMRLLVGSHEKFSSVLQNLAPKTSLKFVEFRLFFKVSKRNSNTLKPILSLFTFSICDKIVKIQLWKLNLKNQWIYLIHENNRLPDYFCGIYCFSYFLITFQNNYCAK